MRCHNQIIIVNPQVAHRGVRQIELQRLPVIAVIERYPHARLGSREEQALAHGILAYGIDGRVVRESARDQPPHLPSVVRAINVRAQIINAETADGSVCGFVVEMRSRKLRHFAPRRDLRRRDIFPVRAAIARDP